MKICAYCGSKVADNVVQCAGCGSTEYKCINCETTFLGNKCPNCSVMIGVQANPYPTFVQQRPQKRSTIFAVLVTLFFIVGFIGVISFLNSDNNTIKIANKSETASRNLPDIELLTLKEHPKFYGDYKAAKSFWKGFDNVKVVHSRQKIFYEDALLLVTSGNEDVITNITINLSDYEEKQSLELDKVMRLICDYIPYDIIEQYYDFKESFHEMDKNGKYEAYHYVMELNDKGKDVNKSGERYFESKFAFQIIHRNDNDWIATINYLAYEGNHDKFESDGVEAWDVDIEKYKK